MPDYAAIKKKTVSGVFSYTLRTGALYLISIIATGLLGVFLTPAEFGTYFIVTSMISLFTFMSDIGLAATLVQKKIEPTIEELRTTFTVQQILALVIIAIIIGLTPLWQQQSHLGVLGLELLYALSLSFLLASMKTIPSILLERKLEFGKLVIPQIVESVVFYGLAVYLAAHGWGIRSYTIAVLARSILGVVTIYIIQGWPIGFAWSKETFKKLVGFGAKFQLNDLLARIKDDLFIVALAKFLPASEMGYIGWAKKWSMFPYQMSVNNVISITFPTYARLQDEKEKLGHAVEKSIFFISLVIFPILAGMVVLALPLTDLFHSYHKWQPAIPSLIFFCVNIAWAAVSSPLTNTLNAIGKISQTLKLMIGWTLSTWVITPICIYFFGYIGVSIASAIIATSSVITLWMIKRYLPVRFIDQVWRQLLCSGIMLAGLWYFHTWWSRSVIWMALGVLFGAVIYCLSIAAVGYQKVYQEVTSLWQK